MFNMTRFDSFGFGYPGLFPVFAILALLALALKGYTLWHAAKRDEKWWFIALLVINTFGLLELAYILFVMKKFSKTEKPSQHDGHHHEKHVDHSKADEEHLVEAD